MKKFIFSLSLVFFVSLVSYSQIQNSPCPVITVNGPQTLVTAGDYVKFAVVLDENSSRSKFSFDWTISQGEIIAGQGTAEIMVATKREMEGSNLKASVSVIGLDRNCDSEFSETAVIGSVIGCGRPAYEYGKKLSIWDEFGRLDNFFVTLQNSIGSRGYILFAIEKSESKSEVKTRISQLLDHFDFRKFDRSLVLFDVCYETTNQTSLWIVPDGAQFPEIGECEKVEIDLK